MHSTFATCSHSPTYTYTSKSMRCPGKVSLATSVHCRGGGITALKPNLPVRRNRGRGSFLVQANELNKWAGRAFDDQCDPSPFDKDTADVLLRVLTARAVKKLLVQLMECDLLVAQWLNNFAAEHPPTAGNKFVAHLLDQRGTQVTDPATRSVHTVDPQILARRILIIRDDLARNATYNLPDYVERENTAILRSHLEKNTFVSGSSGAQYGERRGYYRRRSQHKDTHEEGEESGQE